MPVGGTSEPCTASNRSERCPLYRHGSNDSSQESAARSCGTGTKITRETGLSMTMRMHNRKEGPLAQDQKTVTRIDFGEYYPDGGWGWIVTFAATVVYILCYGFHFAYGTLYLYVREIQTFRTNEIDAVWLGSLGISITLFLSPVITTICRRKSPRLYAVIGGLICALGCLFLAFSKQMEQLFISHCVVFSLGSGITVNTANIMIGRYFCRHRELVEVIVVAGIGLGTAVLSVLFRELIGNLKWMNALQCIAGILAVTIVAGALYRSASIYHPRRKVIMHIKSQKKNRREREAEKPPYFDFSALRMRSIQALMFIVCVIGFGIHVPVIILLKTASDQGVTDLPVLGIYMGIGFVVGCLAQAYMIVRNSSECSISRRNLCQTCAVMCGVLTQTLILAKDHNAHALFAWMFGIFCGGYHYTLKMYTFQLVKVKIMERAWGYINAAQSVSVLVGPPLAVYLNQRYETNSAGYTFAGVSMMVGGLLFFFMPPFENHASNQEIIQRVNNTCSKNTAEAAALLDLDLTDAMVTKPLNNVQFIVSPTKVKQTPAKDGGKIQMQCFIQHKDKEKPKQIVLSRITEEKECLRLDFNEVPLSAPVSNVADYIVNRRDLIEKEVPLGSHPVDPPESTVSNHTSKSSKDTSNTAKSNDNRKLRKSTDNVRADLFDPPSQEKESTATVSYDSDLYINLCEAQV